MQVTGTRRLYSEQTAREIDVAIRELVENACLRARDILVTNRPLLEQSARELLARETLAGAELAALLERVRPDATAVTAASRAG